MTKYLTRNDLEGHKGPSSAVISGHMRALDGRIRQKLRAANPNQQQLAQRMGRSQSWVSKYLAGEGSLATIDDVVAIADFLMTTVSDLIDEKPAPPPTVLQSQAHKIAELWMRAKPRARQCVRDYLRTLDAVNLRK